MTGSEVGWVITSLVRWGNQKNRNGVSIQDYCITLTTQNFTQINTSWQCMLKLIHVSMDWHISHHFVVHTKSSIFVSDVRTLCVHWLIPTSKIITLYIWLPYRRSSCFIFDFLKLNSCQHVLSQFFLSLLLTHVCIWQNV